MPRQSENIQISEIIMSFLDDFIKRYTTFENLTLESYSTSARGGYNTGANPETPNHFFNFEGFFVNREDLKKYVEVFVDAQSLDLANNRGDKLFRIMMNFMDDFFENHLVIDNKKEKKDKELQYKGYRPTKERVRIKVSYEFSGIIPSREEIEAQVKTFLQMKNLSN